MNEHYWRAISVDCIDPEFFPPLPLYIKTAGNYVMYKSAETGFTAADRARLERTRTEFMYVRSGHMPEISAYLERVLGEALSREDLPSDRKGKILFQSAINYLIDAFEEPEESLNLERCRHLVRQMMGFVARDPLALESVRELLRHNFYIFAHSVQVTALNLLAHEKLFGVETDELNDVGVGSMLHDFGMIFIDNNVARKADALADAEYYQLKQHTRKGYEFLKETGLIRDVALHIVRYHHERFDGNGYPTGLKGEKIPRSAELAALCDTYSYLTLEQPDRKPSTREEAFKMIRSESGGAFNPALVEPFLALIAERKEG